MSTAAFDHLKVQILALTESERAELAHDLIASLDAPNDTSISSEWEHEINKRIAQIDAGNATFFDRDTFRKRLELRLKG